jgi:hypothetical protein
MSMLAKKVLGVGLVTVALGVLIALYVASWATSAPPTITPRAAPASSSGANLKLETVAAVGPKFSPSHPDWVSYLARRNGQWVHSTVFRVPANSDVHGTVYQFDGDSSLRNPFLAGVQGTSGGVEMVDGKPLNHIQAEEASHTFVIPQLGVFVPLPGVPEEAKNQCEYAPCELNQAHRTITFTFKTGKKGRYRWQCFVPCAAGTIDGFGGPMQTFGYMDGYIEVV